MLNEYFSGVDIFYEKTFQKWVLSTKKYGLGVALLRISETLGVWLRIVCIRQTLEAYSSNFYLWWKRSILKHFSISIKTSTLEYLCRRRENSLGMVLVVLKHLKCIFGWAIKLAGTNISLSHRLMWISSQGVPKNFTSSPTDNRSDQCAFSSGNMDRSTSLCGF